MSDNHSEALQLQQIEDYRCEVRFGGQIPVLSCDEPPPLGHSAGPSPVQLLLAAVANCLTDSLLFALRKFKQNAEPIHCTAEATVGRNDENRLRVLAIHLEMHLGTPAATIEHLERILNQFEGFCTVTRSVAQGIPVHLTVKDSTGTVVKSPS